MNLQIRNLLIYLAAIIGFVLISLAYFSPVLQGKKIQQSDISQYIGMAKQQIDIRNETGEELYWNDRAFGGMPTYQLGAKYPHNYVKQLDYLIRFLPRPADYLFLYFIGFFILLMCLKVDPLLAFFGSLAFGFSTYLIIIIGVGHNAKAHAIGYMPFVLSGVLLVYANKYIKGGILFCVAMALELVANHYQMTYYLMLLLLIVAIVYGVYAFKNGTLTNFLKASGVLLGGLLLAIALNATSILATREYAEFSTRGKSDITVTPSGEEKQQNNGLETDYILEYSYGFLESFNLIVSRFMGGSSAEDAGEDAAIVKELVRMGYPLKEARNVAKSAPTYWGEQTYVGAPAYIGAGVVFLAILGLFFIESRKKWWLLGGSILALFLSFGKNMEWFSELFINYFPLYNKFRAVTSIQVIIELCFPILAIYGLHKFFTTKYNDKTKERNLYIATGIVGGLLVLFILFKNVLFSFSTSNDAQLIKQAGAGFVSALREDRARMLTNDTLKSLFFIISIAAALFGFATSRISKTVSVLIIGFLIVLDLVMVDRRYVNNDAFVKAKSIDQPFAMTEADKKILKDKSRYRVYDLSGSPFNSGRNPYFHNAIGGYHGAKPQRIQNLFDFYISQGEQSILDMLNVKYFIFSDKKGTQIQENPKAKGNAWFVESIAKVPDANSEILGLKKLNVDKEAIINANNTISKTKFSLDSLATIKLVVNKPQSLKYSSQNSENGFAVFSEMYYKNGWKAFVDNKPTPIIKTNYALRGIEIPKGKHEIEFKFVPEVVQKGSTISLIASIIFVVLVLTGLWLDSRKRRRSLLV